MCSWSAHTVVLCLFTWVSGVSVAYAHLEFVNKLNCFISECVMVIDLKSLWNENNQKT